MKLLFSTRARRRQTDGSRKRSDRSPGRLFDESCGASTSRAPCSTIRTRPDSGSWSMPRDMRRSTSRRSTACAGGHHLLLCRSGTTCAVRKIRGLRRHCGELLPGVLHCSRRKPPAGSAIPTVARRKMHVGGLPDAQMLDIQFTPVPRPDCRKLDTGRDRPKRRRGRSLAILDMPASNAWRSRHSSMRFDRVRALAQQRQEAVDHFAVDTRSTWAPMLMAAMMVPS